MKTTIRLCFVPLFAVVLLAQGPGGGRFGGGPGGGPRGLEGPAGFAGRGAGILGAGPGSATPVTNAPYSAVETLSRQQALTNGNAISTKVQSSVYRDSQGRVRTEETVAPSASSGKTATTIVTIFDPVAGYRYVLDSSTMIALQSPLPKGKGAPPNRPARPTPANVTTSDLGTQTINGESSKGTQLTETIPAGAIGNAQAISVVRVTWISAELSVPVQIKTSDPRIGVSDMELTNIVHGEPNASLFLVPAGYTVQQGGGGGRGPGGPRGAARRGPGLQ